MNRKAGIIGLIGFMVLGLLAGCSMQQKGASAQQGVNSAKREYYCIGVSTSLAYWADAKAGFDERIKQLGVKGQFTGPNNADAGKQAEQFDQIIAKKPSGIIIAPANAAALAPSINRAIEAGIPVVTMDTDSPTSKRFCYVGTNNYESGRKVGEVIGQAIGGKGKIGISMLVGQWNIQERARGVKDALKEKYPSVQIVAQCDDKGDVAASPQANATMITSHPDLVGIVGLDAASGVGIARAVVEAGKTGKIKIVCFDRDDDMLAQIEKGVITASVAQKSYLMAWLSVTMLDAMATNSIPHLPDWKAANAPPIPATVDTGVMVIDKTNVKQFFHTKVK